MIHTLDDYICRSIDAEKTFETNPNLIKKVDKNGDFLHFMGNTVVYDLDWDVKQSLTALQDELYEGGGALLSRRLEPATFHMTLHDLVNGQPEPGLQAKMERIQPAVKNILGNWNNHAPISMEATWMFNMVSTSIVLGLKPADADSFSRLDAMYCALEEVIPLGYPLCPHITLAYFRPGRYEPRQIEKLANRLRAVDLQVTLRPENLLFQNFDHMNCYYAV